jgi:rubrerythrin
MTANDRALKMLATALEMENKGKRFYDQAIAKCKSKAGAEIFQKLAKDELVHIGRIKRIYDAVKAGASLEAEMRALDADEEKLTDFFRALATRHGPKIERHASDLDALDVGLDFEAKAVTFYEGALKQAEDDLERRFLQRMVLEEKDHYAALSDMKLYLTNPAAWFQEHESPVLDG